MEQVLSVIEAQSNFSQIITEAGEAGRETVIQRDSHPIAVLIGYEQYQELLALRQQAQIREARFAVYDEIRRRNLDTTPEQVIADVAEAVSAVRANRQ